MLSTLSVKIKRKGELRSEFPQPLDLWRCGGSNRHMEPEKNTPRQRGIYGHTPQRKPVPNTDPITLLSSWPVSWLDFDSIMPPETRWSRCSPPPQTSLLHYKLTVISESIYRVLARDPWTLLPLSLIPQGISSMCDAYHEVAELHHCFRELSENAKRKHNAFLLGPSCVTMCASGIKIAALFIVN